MKPNVLHIPTWLTTDEARSQMSDAAWKLISYPNSLTQYLNQLTDGKITFRLLLANWGHANPIERQALNLKAQERTWIRCIEHRYKNNLWIYGRAVFPETTIKATKETISGLGVQSLGDIVFKDPNLKRDPFYYCFLGEDGMYYYSNVWARRSILYFQEQPILITEIFMPESYAQPNA